MKSMKSMKKADVRTIFILVIILLPVVLSKMLHASNATIICALVMACAFASAIALRKRRRKK